jgi:hypothetical protein
LAPWHHRQRILCALGLKLKLSDIFAFLAGSESVFAGAPGSGLTFQNVSQSDDVFETPRPFGLDDGFPFYIPRKFSVVPEMDCPLLPAAKEEQAIRCRAYDIWQKAGSLHGRHEEDWAQARKELEVDATSKQAPAYQPIDPAA